MKIKIISQKENPLFSRKEVCISVEDSITPSLLDARNIVSKEFKSDEILVRIKKINTSFGSNVFIIIADIYDSIEEFSRVVKKTKQEIASEKKAIIEVKKIELEKKEAKKNEEKKEYEVEIPEKEIVEEKNKEKVE